MIDNEIRVQDSLRTIVSIVNDDESFYTISQNLRGAYYVWQEEWGQWSRLWYVSLTGRYTWTAMNLHEGRIAAFLDDRWIFPPFDLTEEDLRV